MPEPQHQPYAIAPIPLITGDHIPADPNTPDDEPTPITAITITITGADGSQIDIPLIHWANGWWPPTAPPVAGMQPS